MRNFDGADGFKDCMLFVGWGGDGNDSRIGLVDVVVDAGCCCAIFHLDACFEDVKNTINMIKLFITVL